MRYFLQSDPLGSMLVDLESKRVSRNEKMTEILIVDDDPIHRELLHVLLDVEGYAVREAEDGVEALAVLRTYVPDMILLDIRMPEMDGFEVLRRIRDDPGLVRTPVLMITSASNSAAKVWGLDAGANDFIVKPFDRDEVLARIRAHLRAATSRVPLERSALPRPSPEVPPVSGPTSKAAVSAHRSVPSRASRSSAVQPRQHRLVDGRYLIEAVLGKGAMGTVYLATHVQMGRQVALKAITWGRESERKKARWLEREAHLASQIDHPNVCRIYDMGRTEDGSPYVVMERLLGQSLAARIMVEGALPFTASLEVITQVLQGLQAAHEGGVLHRDIKPDNVFLSKRKDGSEVVKLVDFGVAALAEQGASEAKRGIVMGSPGYIAPERFLDGVVDARSDVYSCGVVLFEMLTGRRPFVAEDYPKLRDRVLNAPFPDPRDIRPRTPEAIVSLVLHATSRDPTARIESARAFLSEVRSCKKAALEGASELRPSLPPSEGIAIHVEDPDDP